MVELKLAIQQLDKTTVNCDVNSDFEENWKLLLPCNTKEEFQEFDNKIKSDQDFRQKLAQKFINLINKRTTIVRNVGEIMRFCLSRDLALKFNPVKPSEGKLFTFVNTNLYNVVKASLLSTFSSIENAMSESEVRKIVSTVLHHSRDWEGGRVKRQKKIRESHEDTTLPQD